VRGNPQPALDHDLVSSNNLIFKANHSNKCLDVAGRSLQHAARVVQHTCDYGPSQTWQAIYLRSVNGVPYYLLQNRNSSRCLDVSNYGTANGTPVVQADCMGTDNQIWDLLNTRTALHGV
jgi:Ricin-type beta-trefoil lectin domain-like